MYELVRISISWTQNKIPNMCYVCDVRISMNKNVVCVTCIIYKIVSQKNEYQWSMNGKIP